jgi:ligand-binding sensor domain-containing protein
MKKNTLYTFLFALLFFSSCKGQIQPNLPQNATKVSITEQAKLPKPQNTYKDAAIGCGLQDKQGNLWFGSNGEGVFCYDGKAFTNFTTKNGLNSNTIYSILEDKTGRIWVGTNKGLNLFNGTNFAPIPFTLAPSSSFNPLTANSNPLAQQNAVWSMMQDKSGKIWFGTEDGIFCYNTSEKNQPGTISFTRFLDNNHIINPSLLQLKAIFAILEDKKGNIWFGSCAIEGISRFDGNTLTQIVAHKNVRRINAIIEDKSENLWFATSFSGVGFYDGKTFTKNFFEQKEGYQSNVIEDKSGAIWFEKVGGLGCYKDKTTKILTTQDGVPENNLFPILEDKTGNLWFSSVGLGLYCYNGKDFINFSEKNTVIETLLDNAMPRN